jgi:hypothetical protein
MTKSHPFSQMSSTKKCACGRGIKKRLEGIHDKCYRCHVRAERARGHQMKVPRDDGFDGHLYS